jgi:hypothetical protein
LTRSQSEISFRQYNFKNRFSEKSWYGFEIDKEDDYCDKNSNNQKEIKMGWSDADIHFVIQHYSMLNYKSKQ